MVEIDTPDGLIKWAPNKVPSGAVRALRALAAPRVGHFGLMPEQVPFDQATGRKDSFLHLEATVWPTYRIISDTVPDEEWSPNVVY